MLHYSSYKLFPGYIQVYIGSGADREEEQQVLIDKGTRVEAIDLPNRPHCLRIYPSNPTQPSIVVQADSQELQAKWIEAVLAKIPIA